MKVVRRLKLPTPAPNIARTTIKLSLPAKVPSVAKPKVSGKAFKLSTPILLPEGNKTNYIEVVERYAAKVKNPKSAIRAKCVECSGGSLKEVQMCPIKKCSLHPFRLGENPFHKKTRLRLDGGVEQVYDEVEEHDEQDEQDELDEQARQEEQEKTETGG